MDPHPHHPSDTEDKFLVRVPDSRPTTRAYPRVPHLLVILRLCNPRGCLLIGHMLMHDSTK